ncbi:M10 family metallopeptidase C-terminal domain-containing protein [Inquilinus limosus]|uniref:calcium-binding protein n=1 Tax=Inquilinus limosus TaxID=171674 RepID=UPI003F1375CD
MPTVSNGILYLDDDIYSYLFIDYDQQFQTYYFVINGLYFGGIAGVSRIVGGDNAVEFDDIDIGGPPQGPHVVYGMAGDDRISGSSAGTDYLDGGAGNDILNGRSASDTLVGGAGNDVLQGGQGSDVMDGGEGTDTADLGWIGQTGSVFADLANQSCSDGDILIDIENLIGGAFNDTLTGDAGANVLTGRDGDDDLSGGDGNDTLFGGRGADDLIGGAGTDMVDYLELNTGTTGVTIDLGAGTASGGSAQGDVLSGIENLGGSAYADTLTGDAGSNTLWGRDGADALSGGAGNDALYGENGVDSLQGGDGNDTLIGGWDADTLDGGVGIDAANYAESFAAVVVNLAAGGSSGPGAGTGGTAAGDTLLSIESVLGSAFADTITGDAVANGVWGMAGNDVLTGGGGADALKGGAGADMFVYKAASDSTVSARDSLNDFSHAEGDRIDLGAIDADGNAGNGDTAFTFLGTGAFTGAGHELRLAVSGGVQVVLADLNGDMVADMAIGVVSATTLVAEDFVL